MLRANDDFAPRAGTRVAVLSLAGLALLTIAVLIGTMIGPAGPQWWRVPIELVDRLPLITVDSGVSQEQWNIVWQIRMPRVVLAVLVGAMPSVAGASYQGVFRNPLVATYVVGSAFGKTRSGATLVLAGIAVTSLTTAIQTFVLQRNNDVVRQVYSWILGRLSSATWGDVRLILPYVVFSCGVLLMHRRLLDVLRVGDDEATALGMNIRRVRLTVVLAATLGTAAAVAVSGLIGFVGIIVPHTVRLIVGSSYRRVLPMSILCGAIFLVLADIPSRVLADPAETPIGVVTAFFGAPFFLLLLRVRKNHA